MAIALYENKYRVKSARLKGWDYRAPGWYFVTICTRDHVHIFGDILYGQVRLSSAGQIANSELRNLPNHYLNISIDCFIVMPNHLHAVIVINGQHCHSPISETRTERLRNGLVVIPPKAGSLAAIVRSYKAGVTGQCHAIGLKNFAWQAGFYDHIVRGNESLQAIQDYIQKNSSNWPQDPESQP